MNTNAYILMNGWFLEDNLPTKTEKRACITQGEKVALIGKEHKDLILLEPWILLIKILGNSNRLYFGG